MTICRLSDIVSAVFSEPHRLLRAGKVDEVVACGGRGSGKSSWASVEGVLRLLENPDIHGMVLRKVGNTLRGTVFNQYVWAVDQLGLSAYFKVTTSPMEIMYRPTGQKIKFMGLDDPMKLKSQKPSFGYFGYLHFEELDQFSGAVEVRNVEQTILRGGDKFFIIKTFNPPQTKLNWANKYCELRELQKPNTYISRTDYRSMPREWLGEKFISDAEFLREIDPQAYEHEYLGIPNGTGGAVFDKLEVHTIPDSQIQKFDRFYQGIDWGWYPDPKAFVRLYFNHNTNTIYLTDEIVGYKMPVAEFATLLRSKGYHKEHSCADCHSPGEIDDLKHRNCQVYASRGTHEALVYGMRWLQGKRIVIDPHRTPNAYKEFSEYEYEKTKDGEILSRYPDKNNHLIDATRYAFENLAFSHRTSA